MDPLIILTLHEIQDFQGDIDKFVYSIPRFHKPVKKNICNVQVFIELWRNNHVWLSWIQHKTPLKSLFPSPTVYTVYIMKFLVIVLTPEQALFLHVVPFWTTPGSVFSEKKYCCPSGKPSWFYWNYYHASKWFVYCSG
jgi:hypothetical protein